MGFEVRRPPGDRWGFGDRARTSQRRTDRSGTFQTSLKGRDLAEWTALGEERDPELFWQGVLVFGQRLEAKGNPQKASEIYGLILAEGDLSGAPLPEIRERARAHLAALQGQGPFGLQAEQMIGGFVGHACDAPSLLAMVGAGATYRVARLGLLRHLSNKGISRIAVPWLSRGGAFALEATSFPLYHRLASGAMGQPVDWGTAALAHDIPSSFLVLGGLKAGGALGGLGRFSGIRQAGMFGGIVAGRQAEILFGLRDPSSAGGLWSESLATLLHFNVAGRLLQGFLPQSYRRWEQTVDCRIREGQGRTPFPLWAEANSSGAFSNSLVPPGSASKPTAPLAMSVLETGNAPGLTGWIRSGEEGKKDRRIAVGADFHGYETLSTDPALALRPELKRVRQQGIESEKDILHAISYLGFLHPQFSALLNEVLVKRIPIRLGGEDLTYSYMTPTFHGLVDRNSPDFGKEIVIERGATPDVLLHEVLHALPIDVIRRDTQIKNHLGFALGEFATLSDQGFTPSPFPPVHSHEPFSQLRAAILENIRLNETLSFAAQALVFELERKQGIVPIFNSEMMAAIDGAWQNGKIRGVRDTFSQYLPHYEERLGWTSILLALIVKVEGRTNLTEEEFALVTRTSQGNLPFQELLERFQSYLKRYAEGRGLDLPPDFFAIDAMLGRIQAASLLVGKEALVHAIDSIFRSLEEGEGQMGVGASAAPRDLSGEPVPPPESQPARLKIFSAFAGVVDRVLDNPPPSLTREELAALVSFLRLLPPAQAMEVSERLFIYLGAGLEDLRISLGLILHEKGLAKGREVVMESLTPDSLPQALPLILKIMGPATVLDLLRQEYEKIIEGRESISRTFRLWALDRFIWEGGPWAEAAARLFQYPELLTYQGWKDLGKWVFENGEVDSVHSEDVVLDLRKTTLRWDLKVYQKREGAFLKSLASFRNHPDLTGVTREALEELRDKFLERYQSSHKALSKLLKLRNDYSLLLKTQEGLANLVHFFGGELEKIFESYPPTQRKRAVTLVEVRDTRPWSYPGVMGELAQILLSTIGSLIQDEDFPQEELELLGKIFEAELRKGTGQVDPRFLKTLRKVSVPGIHRAIWEISENNESFMWAPTPVSHFIQPHFYKLEGWEHPGGLSIDPFLRGGIHQMAALVWTFHLDPSQRQATFTRALKVLTELLVRAQGLGTDSEQVSFLDDILAPYALYFAHQALRLGLNPIAEDYFTYLFKTLPAHFSPEKKIPMSGDETDILTGKLWKNGSNFYRYTVPIQWALRMEEERLRAQEQGRLPEWFQRLSEEIRRGGDTLSLKSFRYFALGFIEGGAQSHLERLYRLMMEKSLISPTRENIAGTFEEIQASPLPDPTKDLLLEEFTERLFALIRGLRGMDLSLIKHLQGLFPWRTPFMKAGDIPHYPRTEALLLNRLAEIPELVEPGEGKNNRIRLGAFAAAGLPLQRYAGWIEGNFDDPQGPAELQALKIRKNYRLLYQALGLPRPQEIPPEFASENVEKFLQAEGKRLKILLSGEDPESADAVLRLLSRLLGSELRWMISQQGKHSLLQVNLNDSVLARYLKKILEDKKEMTLTRLLFSSGPPEVRRLDLALEMLGWNLTREEKRRIFEAATSDLIFSARVRRRLIALQGGSESEELAYYRLLLGIHYPLHPAHMVSDYFLKKLEEDPRLLAKYHAFLKGGKVPELLILTELGMYRVNSELARVRDWMRISPLERMDLYLRAMLFLRRYMEVEDALDYSTDGYIDFKEGTVASHLDSLSQYLKTPPGGVGGFDWLMGEVHEFAEILATAPWARKIDEVLNWIYQRPSRRSSLLEEFFENLDWSYQQAEGLYREMLLEDLNDLHEGDLLPAFIAERRGLERDLLLWTFQSLDPAQRNLLTQGLADTRSDQERLLLMGRASHLEKLLQLASIHPAVPTHYQSQFEVFQDEVPHRDPIDVQRTVSGWFDREDSDLKVDLGRPMKEGTIGGVYRGSYHGKEIVLKVIPEGKARDLEDSLRVVRGVRRYLWASGFREVGSRTVDDLLGFYERNLPEEMDLSREAEHQKHFQAILPRGFRIPSFDTKITFPTMAVMEPLYSRRLKDLSETERAMVIRRIDEELIPAMLGSGIFHYDLHPGNLGLNESGEIVLYDLGRVHHLTPSEREQLGNFFAALQQKNIPALMTELRTMGHVYDEAVYEKIVELLMALSHEPNPLQAIERVFPRLADYGFRLSDSYVKLLFLFVTWEGTKRSLVDF